MLLRSPANQVALPRILIVAASLAFSVVNVKIADAGQLASALSAYHDPVRGAHHVVYLAQDGSLQDMIYNSPIYPNRWQVQQILGTVWGAAPGITTYFDGSIGHLFVEAQGAGIDVFEYYGGDTLANGHDLTLDSHASVHPQGWLDSCPAPGGPFVNCITFGTPLTGFFDGMVEHVFYAGSDAHVHEMYYYNGVWVDHSLGGLPLVSGTQGMTSAWDGSVEHVFYLGLNDGHLEELYFNGNWWGNDLSVNGNVPAGKGPAGVLSTSYDGGRMTVWGLSDGSSPAIQGVTFGPNGWYTSTNQTQKAGYPSSLSYDANGQAQEFFVGTDGLIYQVFPNGTVSQVVPSNPGDLCDPDPPPGSFFVAGYQSTLPSPITGFWDGSLRHLYYINLSGFIIELVSHLTDSTWLQTNLSCAGPPRVVAPIAAYTN